MILNLYLFSDTYLEPLKKNILLYQYFAYFIFFIQNTVNRKNFPFTMKKDLVKNGR